MKTRGTDFTYPQHIVYISIDQIIAHNPRLELHVVRKLAPRDSDNVISGMKHVYEMSLFIPEIMTSKDGFYAETSSHDIADAYSEFTQYVLESVNRHESAGYEGGVERMMTDGVDRRQYHLTMMSDIKTL
jgi:hypothetical protein